MSHLRRAGTREIVLIVVAAVLIAAALFVYPRLSPKDPAPTNQFVSFYCPQCKEPFKLSYREFDDLMTKRQYKQVSGTLLFKCKKCGQMVAQRAAEGGPSPTDSSASPGRMSPPEENP